MNNNRVLGWAHCIIATPEQDTLLGQNNNTLEKYYVDNTSSYRNAFWL